MVGGLVFDGTWILFAPVVHFGLDGIAFFQQGFVYWRQFVYQIAETLPEAGRLYMWVIGNQGLFNELIQNFIHLQLRGLLVLCHVLTP